MGLQIPVGAGSSGMRCVMPSIYKRLGNTIFLAMLCGQMGENVYISK